MSKPLLRDRPFLAPLATLAATLLATPAAYALEDELTLGLGPGYADLRSTTAEGQTGFGGALWLEYRITDYWGLTAGAWGGYQLSDHDLMLPGVTLASGWLGGLYTLDVTTWVPFASLAATFYNAEPALLDTEGNAALFGLKAGLGVDWRRYRWFSLGAEVNLHAFLAEVSNYPVWVTSILRFNVHYEL